MFAQHNEISPKAVEELTLLARKCQNLIETEEEKLERYREVLRLQIAKTIASLPPSLLDSKGSVLLRQHKGNLEAALQGFLESQARSHIAKTLDINVTPKKKKFEEGGKLQLKKKPTREGLKCQTQRPQV